jgi:hypothetical protein
MDDGPSPLSIPPTDDAVRSYRSPMPPVTPPAKEILAKRNDFVASRSGLCSSLRNDALALGRPQP